MTAKRVALSRFALLRHYAGSQHWRLSGILIVSIGLSLATALQPLPLKYLIDNALGNRPLGGFPATMARIVGLDNLTQRGSVVAAGVLVALVGLAFAAVGALQTWTIENVGQRLTTALMRDQLHHLHRLSARYHATHEHGDLMTRVQWDSMAVYTLVIALLVTPLSSLIILVTVGWSAWRQSTALTLVVLAFAPVLALVSAKFGPRLRAAAGRARDTQSDTIQFVTDVMRALPTVQSFTAQERNTRSFRSVSNAAVGAVRRQAGFQALAEALGSLISSFGAAVVLVCGGYLVVSGDLTIGTLVVFIAYTDALRGQAEGLMGLYRTYQGSRVSLDRSREILSATDAVSSPENPRPLPASTRPPQVTLYQVTTGYVPDRPVLHQVDLVIESGSLTALVGPSGAGKSTLVSLIPRLIDPWSGHVFWDSQDTSAFDPAELRRRVAVVRQEPLIFAGTIAHNIGYGLPAYTRQDIEEASRLARIDEFIDTLPERYLTALGEHGTTLSGGQKQRIAIARALIRRAPVIIFDEPTSALDPDSEQSIIQTLADLRGRCTTIVIAHRLSTVTAADSINVLDDGRVVQSGTPHDLLMAGGPYARLRGVDLEVVS